MEQKSNIMHFSRRRELKNEISREIEMPVVIDGNVKPSHIKFETIDDLFDYINDAKRKLKLHKLG